MVRRRAGGQIAVSVVVVASFLASTAVAAPGEPDPSFGSGGQVAYPVDYGEAQQKVFPESVAVLPDGRIEIVGTASPPFGGAWRLFATRLLEGGALDSSFGVGGGVVTSADPPFDECCYPVIQSIHAAAVEGDVSTVAVGGRVQERLTAAGRLDPAFLHGQSPLTAYAVIPLSGGDAMVFGETPTEGGQRYPTLERMLPNGAPDPSFGREGLVQLPDRPGAEVRESVHSAVLLPTGQMLLAGVGVSENKSLGNGQGFAWLAEVNSNGTLEQGFANGGVVYLPGPYPYERDIALAVAPGGRIIVAGEQSLGGEDSQPVVWSFAADGTSDPAFGVGGVARLPLSPPGFRGVANAVTIDGHGYVYVAVNEDGGHGLSNGYVARLTPTGQLDASFARGGLAVGPPEVAINTVALDGAERLVAAGGARESGGSDYKFLFVERLLGGRVATPLPRREGGHAGAREVLGSVSCRPLRSVRRRRVRHRVDHCVLSLRRVKGHWRALEVLVTRGRRRLARRRLEPVRMPARFSVSVLAGRTPLHWTVVLHGRRGVERATWSTEPL